MGNNIRAARLLHPTVLFAHQHVHSLHHNLCMLNVANQPTVIAIPIHLLNRLLQGPNKSKKLNDRLLQQGLQSVFLYFTIKSSMAPYFSSINLVQAPLTNRTMYKPNNLDGGLGSIKPIIHV